MIGVIAAGFVAMMSRLASLAHEVFFNLQPGDRLSDLSRFDNAIVPMAGGLALCAMTGESVSCKRKDHPDRNVLDRRSLTISDVSPTSLKSLRSA